MNKIRLKAFSLLEIAISLVIIGVIIMSVMKGQQILQQARIEKTAAQIDAIIIAINVLQNNQGSITSEPDILKTLVKNDLMNEKQLNPAIGGKFFILAENNFCLILAAPDKSGFLDKQTASTIVSKINSKARVVNTDINSEDNKSYAIYVDF